MKILVIDDSATSRKFLRVLLTQEGHTVLEGNDGVEALHILALEQIDVVISDILMPRMDGYRLCHQIRRSSAYNAVPIILYSATYTSLADERMALDFGATKFLKKPASPEEVIDVLHQVMNGAAGRHRTELQEPQELLAMREYSETLVKKLKESNEKFAAANKILEERTILASFNAEIAHALTQRIVLAEILQLCTEAMVRHLNAAFARIWTYNQNDHVLEMQASAGMYTHLNGGHARVPMGEFKIGLIASEQRPHLTNYVIGDPRVNDQEWAKREGMVAFAGYPLIVEERLVGVIAMFAKNPLSQNTLDAMASVADGIAAGIERKFTEIELRQSEERFRELAENINEVFFSISADGSALHYVSPAYEQVFGRKKETLYQNPHAWLDAVHSDDRRRVGQADQNHPEAFDEEYRIVRPDGQLRWIHARTFPVKNSAGEIVRRVGFAEDITERKRSEEKVQQNLQRIRALRNIDTAISSTLDLRTVLNILLENIELFLPIAVATTVRLLNDETGKLESLACRGLDEEEWRRQQQPTPAGRAQKIVETRAPVTVRNIVDDQDTYNGDIFRKHGLVSYLGMPLIAKDKPLGVLSLYTNHEHEFDKQEVEFLDTLAGRAAIAIHNAQLHEQTKKQHLALIEQEGIQRVMKELSQDITTMTVDRLLEKLTATIRQLLNVDIADVHLIGAQKLLDLLVSSDQRVERFGEGGGFNGASQWVINQRRSIAIRDFPAQTEFPLGGVVEKFGIRGFLAAPLTARSGQVIGVIRALSKEPRDFSAQEIDLFEQLANGAAVALVNEQLYTESQKASRAKSEFLCVMSHELRTPLNVIMGYAALVKEDMERAGDERHRAWLETIQAQARELQDMFDAIMQATAIESGSARANFDQVDCSGLLQDLQETHEHRAKKKVAVIWNYPVDLPPLRTDPAKLRWILHNLIKNAIKFTDQGSVTVSARLRARTNRTNKESAKQKIEETTNGRMGERRNLACLEVSVTDTGIGIAKETLPIIFDIFRQVDSSDTRAYGGAGLGLYIVKKLTEVLGGTVDVQSVLGKGSTFVVSIPCEPLCIVARPADTRTSARQSEGRV